MSNDRPKADQAAFDELYEHIVENLTNERHIQTRAQAKADLDTLLAIQRGIWWREHGKPMGEGALVATAEGIKYTRNDDYNSSELLKPSAPCATDHDYYKPGPPGELWP